VPYDLFELHNVASALKIYRRLRKFSSGNCRRLWKEPVIWLTVGWLWEEPVDYSGYWKWRLFALTNARSKLYHTPNSMFANTAKQCSDACTFCTDQDPDVVGGRRRVWGGAGGVRRGETPKSWALSFCLQLRTSADNNKNTTFWRRQVACFNRSQQRHLARWISHRSLSFRSWAAR